MQCANKKAGLTLGQLAGMAWEWPANLISDLPASLWVEGFWIGS